MKWERKQQQNSSSSSSSGISLAQVFPCSWITKLKQRSSKLQPQPQFKPASPKPSTGPNSKPNLNSKPPHLSRKSAFHVSSVVEPPHLRCVSPAGDEDVSFHCRRSKRRGWSLESARFHTKADPQPEFPPLSCRSDLERSGSRKFTDMISDLRRSRNKVPVPAPPPLEKGELPKEQRRRRHSDTPRRRIEREDIPSRTSDQAFTVPLKPIQTSDSRNSEGTRRSFGGKMRQRNRVKVYSPRKAKKRPSSSEEKRLERFAVVKCSYDPAKDFRDSMVEMIVERGIGRRPEEMENLLACYLSLNSDEYHDVIVKVFRRVWFDLNREVM